MHNLTQEKASNALVWDLRFAPAPQLGRGALKEWA